MAIGGAFVAGSIISKLIMDTTQWSASVKAVTSKTARMGQSLTKVGGMLTKGLTLPLALAGAAAVKASANFEQKLVNAFSVTGSASEKVKQQMSDLAREMGATTVFAATEAADAMYYMASAGWKADDMAAALKDTLDLAAATQSDLAMATEAVISTINQFGLTSADAGRVSNVFASAISNSQATMDRLKTSMKYVGPVMNSLGKSVEETSSVLMGLYNAGIDASTAGTALNMGLTKLMIPTNRSTEALERLGLTFEQVNPETHKLADIIQILGERGATTKDIMMLFGLRAGPAFAALIAKGGGALKDYETAITGTNRAAEMAEMQIDTFKGSFKLLTSALTESAISIGDVLAPAIRSIADGITGLIAKFNELGPQSKAFILTLGGIAAAMGPVAMILGKVLILVGKLKAAFIASKAAFMISASGIGILVIALGTLVYWILKVKMARDEANAAAQRSLDQEAELSKKLGEMRLAMKMKGAEFHKLLKQYDYYPAALAMAIKQGKHGVKMQKALAEVSKKHREEIEKQKDAMDDGILTVAKLTAEFNKLDGVEDEAKKAAEEWVEFMKSIGITTIKEKADRVKDLEGNLEKLHALYKAGALDMKEYVEGVNKIKNEITDLSTTLTTTALPAAKLTSSDIANVYSNAVGVMETRTGDFKQVVKEKAVEIIDIGKEFSSTFASSFNNSIIGMLERTITVKEGILNILGNLKSRAIQIFADMATGYIMKFAKKLITGTLEAGTSVVGNLAKTSKDILGTVKSWSPGGIVGSAISGAISGLVSGLIGGKGGLDSTDKFHLKNIWLNTNNLITVEKLQHEIRDHALRTAVQTEGIPIKLDVSNRLLDAIKGFTKSTAKAAEETANQLKNLKSAQGGGIFKQTELAVMHGTPSTPEIAAPAPMFEKFTAARGKSTDISMRTEMNFHIDIRDQIDPHSAQRIMRETMLPQMLRAVEINEGQSRTKLEEILKLRI